ncbi:cytochrome P450 PksS [Nocardiopsis sp. Huas11]|uniref:cytochrome P450 n=1 Tax=Nocardiopsis sp. Huas11 TaxID=2183912 RepID=UPI000EB1D727|nr:cytochrome P450 [Nocardiopsis sp. Huas11]RKS10372.1 cytochrome P450 PksS [Nocardiopsis sp. Huas11]
MTALSIDLTHEDYRLRPWPLYERLRDEFPVHHVKEGAADGEDFYMFSRYDDVRDALRDRELFSSHVMTGAFDVPVLVNRDAPEHTRLRRNANRGFNARIVQNLDGWVTGVIDDLIEDAVAQGTVDWVEAFSTTLPLRVVGDMLGVPLDRKKDLRRWSQAIMDMFAVAAGLDPEEVPGFFEDVLEFGNYMGELTQQRKGGPNRGDILGELVVEHEAGNLSQDELVVMAWSFIAAGYETTMNLLSGGLEMLLSDPELGERMRAEPDRTDDFIAEYLRLFSPIQWTLRRTTREIERHGLTVPEGSLVHLVIGAANRDPRKFDDPAVFDIDRANGSEHVGFGAGSHFCPGAALTRLLAGRAFRAYYANLDRLALDPAQPPRMRTRQGAYGIAEMKIRTTN